MPYADIPDQFTLYDSLGDAFARHDDPARVIATDLTAEQALTRMRELALDAARTQGRRVVRMWNHTTVEADGDLIQSHIIVPVRPRHPADLEHLMRTSLRTRWPAAAFTTQPPYRTDAQVEWIDGPTPATVRAFIDGWISTDHPFGATFTLRRHYSVRGWQHIIDRAESALSLTVPRSDTGEVDWIAAQQIHLPTPIRFSHLDTDDADRYSTYGLDEVLRMLPDYIGLPSPRYR
ncbi:hypothetical protein OIE68_46045 [Nocardia vinacea]|uniref:hypothetical protein n=1 Tax=Nocardia vinacea TaxID=96468 RepID=UPI002E10CFF7|nr:hypothetical protein OIE68_46045 [Nocardia vinacea]